MWEGRIEPVEGDTKLAAAFPSVVIAWILACPAAWRGLGLEWGLDAGWPFELHDGPESGWDRGGRVAQ